MRIAHCGRPALLTRCAPMTLSAPLPEVLAVDGPLWVFAKPAGVLVHPAGGDDAPDLLTWARTHAGAPAALAPVHRLDKDTSGVVLCAATPRATADLARHFAAGAVHKTYLALVVGQPPASGRIARALADARRGRPLPAATRFEALERLGGFTLLALHPETGRKHQLRRHLEAVGHPIVGDTRYGLARRPGASAAVPAPARLWLHARRVELPDGRAFEAPLAPELAAHLAALRAATGAPGC